MRDILRERLMRKIESLPEGQVYETLDYIEFLERKYGTEADEETSGLRRFAEAMEDKLRRKSVSPAKLREAFQLLSAADRVISNVSSAGRKLMEEFTPGGEGASAADESSPVDKSSVDALPATDGSSQAEELPPADQLPPADELPTVDEASAAEDFPHVEELFPEKELRLVDELSLADELHTAGELPPIDGPPPVDGSPQEDEGPEG